MAPPVPLATGLAALRLSARCTASAAHPSGLAGPPAPSAALHNRTPAARRAHAVAAYGRGAAAAAAAASPDGDGAAGGSVGGLPVAPPLGDSFWRDGGGFPHYLQSKKSARVENCECSPVGYSELEQDAWRQATAADFDPMWNVIRAEAQADAASEPLLSSFLYAAILSHTSLERSLAFVLANRLSSPTLLSTQLAELCTSVLESNEAVALAARCDVAATRARDPACRTHADCLLHFKGYHALQAHRIAHALWLQGRTALALALQSRCSEVFAVDIHPAATIGRGILLDHGTGVVIGETAVVGDRVSICQGVTLGGTGKETGDRHPKISEGVLLGAHACVLGNITVGQGAMVAAGSLVLKPVRAHAMVAGSPAKEVGETSDPLPSLSMKIDKEKVCAEWNKMAAAAAAEAKAKAEARSR